MSTATADKQELINWINQLDDLGMIENIKMLKKGSEGKDWWHEITDAEQAGIKRGLADVEAGRTISHKEFMKKHADRL